MFFERKKKEIMGTAANASLKVEGEQRRIHGRDIPNSNTSSISDCTYEVKSMESARTYNVQVIASHCSGQPDCVPQCTNEECKYLCRHMIQCTCVDYGHGHLCKHAHKVNTISDQRTLWGTAICHFVGGGLVGTLGVMHTIINVFMEAPQTLLVLSH